MNEILSLARSFGQAEWMIWVAVFSRIGAACALLPGFGEKAVPARVKLMAAFGFTAILIPLLWDEMSDIVNDQPLIKVILFESVTGLVIGVFFRLIVTVLQIAGAVAAQSTSLSQIFGAGIGAEPQAAFSSLLVLAGLALAANLGLHVYLVKALLWSYDLFPALQLPVSSDLSEWGVAHISHVFAFGFSLAAPFVIASVVYNFGLGVINRAMPQLMVALVGAPAISLGGLVILFTAAPLILMTWVDYLEASMDFRVPNLP